MNIAKTCVAAATVVTALGSALAPQRADADVYPAVVNSADTWVNYSARTTSLTPYYITGADTLGSATSYVEPFDGYSGLGGVRVHITTAGGSNYVKGFVRCQQNQNTTIKKAVYTNYDYDANGDLWSSYCEWLNDSTHTYSRVGWGGSFASQDSNVRAVSVRYVGEFNTIAQNVRVAARVTDSYTNWINNSARPAISFDATHAGVYEAIGPF